MKTKEMANCLRELRLTSLFIPRDKEWVKGCLNLPTPPLRSSTFNFPGTTVAGRFENLIIVPETGNRSVLRARLHVSRRNLEDTWH